MNDEIKNFSNMDDKKIIKNMKKITGKVSDARPILQHIYYNDNTIVATDSHRLLQINKSIIKLMFYIMQKLEKMGKLSTIPRNKPNNSRK